MTFSLFSSYHICITTPFYRWRSEYSEKLSNFPPNVMKPGNLGVRIWIRSLTPKPMQLLTTFANQYKFLSALAFKSFIFSPNFLFWKKCAMTFLHNKYIKIIHMYMHAYILGFLEEENNYFLLHLETNEYASWMWIVFCCIPNHFM